MKISIRLKFTLGLSIIFLACGIGLNILIRDSLQGNFEKSVKTSMSDLMNNSREYIHYRLVYMDLPLNEESIKSEASYILKYFSSNYNCNSQIRNASGELIESNGKFRSEALIMNGVKSAKTGKAVVNLSYDNNNVYGILSYPLYYDNQCIGIINISKNYSEVYMSNNQMVNFLTIAEGVIFLFLAIFSFIFVNKLITPISVLTKGIKKVGEGDYTVELKVKSRDELGVLTREFINMEKKIKNQMDIIKNEKDKVVMLEKGRRQFFNNVTHELKTPLTAISGYAQILSDENVTDISFKNRATERIYYESERLHSLVLDLINVSKGLSAIDEEKQSLDMGKILKDICTDMNIKANKYSMNICTHISDGLILGQPNKIKQLIINILDNSIKFSYSGENVILNSYAKNNYYVMEVCNKGTPIPEEVYKSIFDPFIKTHNNNEIGSSGLGLYICSEIVKEHNGELKIVNGEIIKIIIKIPLLRNTLETT